MNFIRQYLRKRRARRKEKKGVLLRPIEERGYISADYYQGLHDNNKAYQKNNWLTDQKKLMELAQDREVLEFGCGNGRFTRQVAGPARRVIALDWAKSPGFDNIQITWNSCRTAF